VEDPRLRSDSSLSLSPSHRFGTALQSVRKLIKDLGNGSSENLGEYKKAKDLELKLLGELRWKVWESLADRQRVLNEPKDYAPF